MFVNAAICDDDYQPVQKPILVQFVHASDEPALHGCEEDEPALHGTATSLNGSEEGAGRSTECVPAAAESATSTECEPAAAESATSVAPKLSPDPRS